MRWSRNTYEVVLITCDPYLWAVQPFAYLFNKYWDDQLPVRVFGYERPRFRLPSNFTFDTLGVDTGPKCWSDGFLKALSMLDTRYCVLMLEDYWLRRPVKIDMVEQVQDFMKEHGENVMGVDLTNQGMSTNRTKWYGTYKSMRLLYNPCGVIYQFHLQSHMFDVEKLLNFVEPGWDPWDTEVQGTMKMWSNCEQMPLMLSTNVYPVQYEIAVRKRDPKTVHKRHRFASDDVNIVDEMIPPDWRWMSV